MNIINDTVRFPEAVSGGRVITRTFNTYPVRVFKVAAALQGIDYGFSDDEGPFFRCTIDVKAEIVSIYQIKVSITYGLRSNTFNKATDATISYSLIF
jgi:hypothetical protein